MSKTGKKVFKQLINFRFWIAPSESIPGRSALLITSYLILTNMSASAVDFDPPTFTAMDVWFYACRFLVGGAIIEFFIVVKKSSSYKKITVKIGAQQIPMASKRTAEEVCVTYDQYSFIIFNAVFGVFCVAYVLVCYSLR